MAITDVPLFSPASTEGRSTREARQNTATLNVLKVQLGTALQKHRLRRGLTQAQVAEFADLSLKYVGEIERGEANTTLETIARLAEVVGWNPIDAIEGAREPITEGIRVLLMAEARAMTERLKTMTRWLQALDPARHPEARLSASTPGLPGMARPRKRVRSRARPSPARKGRATPA